MGVVELVQIHWILPIAATVNISRLFNRMDMTMKRIILALLLLLPVSALAADNTVILTPGVGVTMRTKDIGAGVQSPYNILGDVAGAAIYGTAGTANSNVLSVQGIASGTALPISANNLGVSQFGTWNITNISGTISLPTGAATAANQTTANTSLATIATNTGLAIPAGTALIGKVGFDQTTPGTTNGVSLVGVNAATALAGNGVTGTGSARVTIASDNTAFSVNAQFSGTALIADPCQSVTATISPISITTNTTTKIADATTSKKLYICYLFLTSAAADNVAIIEGTGSTCGSGTAGLVGGTTAANGLNFAANGGAALGNGRASVAATAATNTNLCLITSAATPLAGVMKAVYAP